MEGRIIEEVEVFVQAVKAHRGEPFNICDLLHVSVSNIICSMAFGRRYEHDDKTFKGLVNAMSDNLSNSDITGLLTFFPFLKYIPGDPVNYKRVMGNVDLVYTYLSDLIQERKSDIDFNEPTNYVDAFLKKQMENPDSTFTGKYY